MNRMIHPDRSGIVQIFAQGSEFRVPVLQTLNMRSVMRHAIYFRIPVALRATFILRRNKVPPPAVLRMARRATKRVSLRSVVYWPIMAR
jgi:hypothetical protein